jgi:hypothetical protein
MSATPFTHVDDKVLVESIEKAQRRLVFIAPGLHAQVADALARAMGRLPSGGVHIVLDVDAEVCRLGYGDADFKGVEKAQAAARAYGLTINHHAGVRIGLLITDEATLVYSPVPRLIEAGSHQSGKPNGILLESQIPDALAEACGIGPDGEATLAIGEDPMKESQIDAVKADLAANPPKPFDLARIERVFNSHLHYVEWEIRDYKLASRSVMIRSELFGLRHADVVRRMTNRYHLFAETDSLNVEIPEFDEDGKEVAEEKAVFGPKSIDDERRRITKQFLFSGGEFGLLILRRDVPDFERQLKRLEAQVNAYQSAVKELLTKRCEKIVSELLDAMKGALSANPPDHWRTRLMGKKITEDDVKRLFEEDIRGEVDRAQTGFNPRMFHAYKDVTYRTIHNKDFRARLEKRFGKAAADQLFPEHDAAPENPS